MGTRKMAGGVALRHCPCFLGGRMVEERADSNEPQMMMSATSVQENESPRPRDSRRRELRKLLVSAADAARRTRQSAMNATIGRAVPQAVRERIARFLASAR